VFRIAYAEHPDYVPLALGASELWDEYAAIGETKLTDTLWGAYPGPSATRFDRGDSSQRSDSRPRSHSIYADGIRRTLPSFAPDEKTTSDYSNRRPVGSMRI